MDVFDGSILFHLGALGGDVCLDGIKGMLNPVARGRLLWGMSDGLVVGIPCIHIVH